MGLPKHRKVEHVIVWVTAPDLRTTRKLARLALNQRLVACAQIRPGLESHYWWQGRCEQSREVLLTFKTQSKCVAALEKLILAEHPYDTPQFVVAPLIYGPRRYLDWIEAETAEASAAVVKKAPGRKDPKLPSTTRKRPASLRGEPQAPDING